MCRYWNVEVDPAIIKDHGDIWNDRARAMMAAIFRMNIPAKMNAGAAVSKTVVRVQGAATAVTKAVPAKPNLNKEPDFRRLDTPKKP